MSNNAESGDIPRGLIGKRGTPHTSTQRLPSLKSESQASQALMSKTAHPTAATTKGGALKRTFKPTIPVRRNHSEESSSQSSSQSSGGRGRGRSPRNNTRNRGGKQNNSKNFIQLDAAVFTGAHNPELNSNRLREGSSLARSRSSISNENKSKSEYNPEKGDDKEFGVKHESKVKVENKAGLIRKLYGDNFIDDYESDSETVLPKGWESVSSHRVVKQSNAEPLTPYNLLHTDSEEKLLLMQIPEEFLKRQDGYIGKIRVYKSGRIELEDTESGVKFDIMFDKNQNLTQNVKQENSSMKSENADMCSDLTQDVVSFSKNNLSVLGSLKHQQILLSVPQIPLDEKIGPSIPL